MARKALGALPAFAQKSILEPLFAPLPPVDAGGNGHWKGKDKRKEGKLKQEERGNNWDTVKMYYFKRHPL
jgi:hypothetical protein